MNSTSSIFANVNNIHVLNGTNFKKWKEHVIIVLGCIDLDYALREDRPSDLTSASIVEQRSIMEKWERSNRMSLMIMKHSIPEAIRGAIPEETRAKAFLDQIANRFAANEKVETNTILSKLVSMRYKGKENIREYIMEMSNLVTRLKALKLELSEDILMHLVLISPYTIYLLLSVYKRKRLKQEKIESAHLASTSHGFGTNKKRKRDNKGKQTAVSGTSKQKVQNKQDKEITCFFCKKVGHMKKTCTKYAAWREKKGTLLNFVCLEINLAVVPIDTWWIDTSATTHISVTMQGCLRSRMPTDGERYIYVGNGNKAVVKAISLFRLQLDSGYFQICIECIKGKQTNMRKNDANRCSDVLELIHMNICGPFPTPSWNGQQYFITFIDDYSRYGYLYLIHEKSQSLDVFKNFKAEVENQLSKKIKVVRSDRRGEYYGRYDGSSEQCPGPFAKYLMECGIVPQYTMPGTPSQNGVVERRNRTLKDMVRSMIIPRKAVAKTPYELWTSKKPIEARPYKPNEKKLDSKTVSYYFVGYSERPRGFKFYDPSTRFFFETSNAKFIEDVELSGREPLRKVVFEEESVSIPIITTGHGHIIFDDTIQNVQSITEIQDTHEIPLTLVMEPIQVHEEVTQQPQEPQVQVPLRRSTRERRISQVKQSFDSKKWIEALKDEMKSMKDNGVGDLVELPEDVKPIGCKWIFKTKRDSKGHIVRYKARLVTKGFTQKEGIDYKEAFSPVSLKDSFRIIMALVAHYDLKLHQMHVKTTFLNGNIDETIYMVRPENFESNDSKQLENTVDQCIYLKFSGSKFIILGLYVDDILLIYRDHSRGDTPVAKGDKFSLHQCSKNELEKKDMEKFPYASAIGSLMYAQVCTRPDIVYIVGMLGRYLSNLGMDHWKKAKRVIRRRSTSSYIFMLAGEAVSWKSVKQTLIVSSTMEKPLRINCDNKAVELYYKNNRSSSKSKHIDIKFLVVKERVQSLRVSIEHISTNSMIADLLTKDLPPKVYHEHVTYMGVVHIDDVLV
ncbi:hypothetical protein AAG906_003165 [Vitis piasezkii]